MSDTSSTVLGVVIDCGDGWANGRRDELQSLIEQLLIFLNAYHLYSASNQLLVLASHPDEVLCLWPATSAGPDAVARPCSPHALRVSVANGLLNLAQRPPAAPEAGESGSGGGAGVAPPLLSAAFATALCRLERARRLRVKVEPRLLLIHASPDSPSQHLASMNCVFAAQKLGILIDTVSLARGDDSMVLQQAAHLTGGLHLRPDEPTLRGLSQYLITHCLPSRQARQFLCMPRQRQPETRALCFLSKDPVEIGHACSVCLAVFRHDNLNACPVCGTRFALALPPRKKLKKAPAASKPTAPPSGGASVAS